MLLPIALLLLLAAGGSGATYYVAPNGSDTEPGSSTAPFRTLKRAVAAANAGDSILVRNGTYGPLNAQTGGDASDNNYSAVVLTHSGNPSAWITIKAENKWGAILDCQMKCDSYINLYNASYVSIENFVITHGYKEGIHSNDAAHHIALRGNRFEYIGNRPTSTRFGLSGMYTNPNCHDFLIDGNEFHDIGRTNTSWLDHGLYLHGSAFTITNNVFYRIEHGWSIQAADGLRDVLIANNTFAFANGGGQGGQIMLWRRQTNITIQNNIFYNPKDFAIARHASSLSNCVIDHNIVYGAELVMRDTSGCLVDAIDLGVNPQFVNASREPFDFHVRAESPAVRRGRKLNAVASDFEGKSRENSPHPGIGAFQTARIDDK